MEILEYLRSFRICNFAIFNFVASFLAFYLIAIYFTLPIIPMMLLVLPIAVLVHLVIGQITPLTEMFLTETYVKVIILLMLVIGIYML